MKRTAVIEEIAAVLFGRDPETKGPEKGWRAKLARALGMTNMSITDTLKLDSSPVFDRKVRELVDRRSIEMVAEIERLRILAQLLARADPRSRDEQLDE